MSLRTHCIEILTPHKVMVWRSETFEKTLVVKCLPERTQHPYKDLERSCPLLIRWRHLWATKLTLVCHQIRQFFDLRSLQPLELWERSFCFIETPGLEFTTSVWMDCHERCGGYTTPNCVTWPSSHGEQRGAWSIQQQLSQQHLGRWWAVIK